MFEKWLPSCKCGKYYEWTPFEIEGSYREIFADSFTCNVCGRVACFINVQGGNAFVVPVADTEVFPPEVREYIIDLREKFAENARQIESSRRAYEEKSYRDACMSHKVRPDLEFKHHPQRLQVRIAIDVARIFIQDKWQESHQLIQGLRPHFTPFAIVSFFVWEKSSQDGSLEQKWYQLASPRQQ